MDSIKVNFKLKNKIKISLLQMRKFNKKEINKFKIIIKNITLHHFLMNI
jgi:hypothetical protein